MLGLAVLFFVGLFLLVTLVVVWLTARWAKRHGRRGWVWGGVAALAMYNLMFWDLIPTLLIHNYYCASEAGFWVYKTPEQWVKENPGVLETLSVGLPNEYKVKSEMKRYGGYEEYLLPDGIRLNARYSEDHRTKAIVLVHVSVYTPNGWSGIQLNERLRYLWKKTKDYPLSIRRNDEQMVDVRGITLLRWTGFSWGQSNALSLGPSGPVRALGTTYLAGGGGCSTKTESMTNHMIFEQYMDYFLHEHLRPYKGD